MSGEPALVGACHCTECQRRTGSPLGVSAYFPKEQVRTDGPNKVYVRDSDSGQKIELHFCPDCGSTLFWRTEFVPDLIGIAFGAFADSSMPRPERRRSAVRRRGSDPHWDRGSRALSSAAWADGPDQLIKPCIVLLDPFGQGVFVRVDLVRANLLVRACLDWLPLAYESLDVTMFFRLGGVPNSH